MIDYYSLPHFGRPLLNLNLDFDFSDGSPRFLYYNPYGFSGQLPNLDLVSTILEICKTNYIPISIETLKTFTPANKLAVFLSGIFFQTLNHSPINGFPLKYGINSIIIGCHKDFSLASKLMSTNNIAPINLIPDPLISKNFYFKYLFLSFNLLYAKINYWFFTIFE